MHELIDVNSISPYIRFVNDVTFTIPRVSPERIIYDHEFIYGLEGEAEFVVDGKSYTMKKGSFLYIKPHVSNYFIIKKGQPFRAHCIHFDWIKLSEAYDFAVEQVYYITNPRLQDHTLLQHLEKRPNYEIRDVQIPVFSEDYPFSRFQPLFHTIYHTYEQHNIYEKLQLKAQFIELVLAIFSLEKEKQQSGVNYYHQALVQKSLDYIAKHYAEKLTPAMFAEQYELSAKYFGIIFKKTTGNTLKEYIKRFRMEKTKELLTTTDMTLECIAEKTGIHDVYYFIKQFKETEGITPGQYRKMFRLGNPNESPLL